MRPASDRDAGFTLIELLVVIIIIGILASIAIPVYLNQRKKAADAALKSDVRAMAIAMNTWYADDPTNMSIPAPAGNAGWSIIARTTPQSVFEGDTTGSIAGNVYPATFPAPQLTSGSAMGVLATVGGATGGAFCIVANAVGSSFEAVASAPSGTSRFIYALYYDSIAGGTFTGPNLPAGGACNIYHNRIASGV